MDVPEWIINTINTARVHLGIGDEWRITVKMSDAPGSDQNALGWTYCDPTYFNAAMEVSTDIRDDQEYAIWHEMVHIALSDFSVTAENLLPMLDECERSTRRDVLISSLERCVQRLSRALSKHEYKTEE